MAASTFGTCPACNWAATAMDMARSVHSSAVSRASKTPALSRGRQRRARRLEQGKGAQDALGSRALVGELVGDLRPSLPHRAEDLGCQLTKTPLSTTSLKWCAPLISRIGLHRTPGLARSMMNWLSPACRRAASAGPVRTKVSMWWAWWAWLVQTFVPLTSQPPSARSARVRTAARSSRLGVHSCQWQRTARRG